MIDTAAAAAQISAVKELARAHPNARQQLDICGWRMRLIYQEKGKLWRLSMRLHPPGRSSTGDDWKFLGGATGHLGAPQLPIESIADVHPNDPLHWEWSDEGVVPAPEAGFTLKPHGPVKPLPDGWKGERWELPGTRDPAMRWRRGSLLVAVNDGYMLGVKNRHVSASRDGQSVTDEDARLIEEMFLFPEPKPHDPMKMPSGVTHWIQRLPDPDADEV